MNIKKFTKLIVFLIPIIILGICVIPKSKAAATANFSFTGSTTLTPNATGTIKLFVNLNGGSMSSLTGTLESDNESCVTITGGQGSQGVGYTHSTKKISYFNTAGGISGNQEILSINIKAGANACTANIKASNLKGGFDGSTEKFQTNASIEITVNNQTSTPKNTDATLKGLTPNKGTLSPAFNKNTENYTLEVESNVSSVTFTAPVTDTGKATVTGTTCALSTNPTACKIIVTAEDGTTKKTYTVNVSKKTSGGNTPGGTTPGGNTPGGDTPGGEDPNGGEEDPTGDDKPTGGGEDKPGTPVNPKSSDSTLASLVLTDNDGKSYPLSPAFKGNNNTYTITVPNIVSTLHIAAIPNDENAVASIPEVTGLKVGTNVIRIPVTAEDGSQRVYIINVVKKDSSSNNGGGGDSSSKSSDNYLKDIIVSQGVLSPTFNKNTNTYNITVPNQVTSLDLKTEVNDSTARVRVNGNSNFNVCTKENLYCNTVTIEVTAQDGSLRVYTINVNRSEVASKNKLDKLLVGNYALSPTFDPSIYEYNVTVDADTDKLDLSTFTQNANSKVEIYGNEKFKEGMNTVLIKVTDENGFVQYYRINVTKKAKSANKFLGLVLSQWLVILGALLLVGLFILILFLILSRRRNEVIEFKPEINISSKNGTDDDYVAEGGVLNQYGDQVPPTANKVIGEADVKEIPVVKEIPYDIYDDVVTKDELFDALQEAKENNDYDKLKMLYAQELLNRQKDKIKEKDDKDNNA